MPDYVAFLRAINLGRNRKYPMAELRLCLESAGFEGVETYLQTGNVRVRSRLRSADRVADRLERAFAEDRGFEVPTVVLATAELRGVVEDAASIEAPVQGEDVRRFVTLLRDPTPAGGADRLAALDGDDEAARLAGRAVHLWVRDGYRNARLDNARLERIFGVATTRTLAVVETAAARWA